MLCYFVNFPQINNLTLCGLLVLAKAIDSKINQNHHRSFLPNLNGGNSFLVFFGESCKAAIHVTFTVTTHRLWFILSSPKVGKCLRRMVSWHLGDRSWSYSILTIHILYIRPVWTEWGNDFTRRWLKHYSFPSSCGTIFFLDSHCNIEIKN